MFIFTLHVRMLLLQATKATDNTARTVLVVISIIARFGASFVLALLSMNSTAYFLPRMWPSQNVNAETKDPLPSHPPQLSTEPQLSALCSPRRLRVDPRRRT